MSQIVVTGAFGWIGKAVSSWLLGQGFDVCGLDKLPSGVSSGSRYMAADIRFPLVENADLINLVKGSACLIHCAGHARSDAEARLFFDINSAGTQNIVQLCQAAGIPKIVYVSTISIYDWRRLNGPASEDSPVQLDTAYAKSKYEGELFVKGSELDWRIARLSTVYGWGDFANFLRLAAGLKQGRFILPGKGSARKSVLPISLAGKLLGSIAANDACSRSIINLALPEAPTLSQIVDTFCECCGFRQPMSLPVPLLRILGICGDLISKFKSDFPLTTATVSKLTYETVVSILRMEETLGKSGYGTFADNLRESAEYYRKNGNHDRQIVCRFD